VAVAAPSKSPLSPKRAWLRWLEVERGLAPSTIAGYKREVALLGAPAESISTADLRKILWTAGGSAATIGGRIAAWRSFFGFMVRQGHRADDPTLPLDRPRARRGVPRPVDKLEEKLAQMDEQTRNIAIFLVSTGLRISEACSVDTQGEPAPEVLIVKGKGSKERPVPLMPRAREALDALGGRIPLGVRAVQRRVKPFGFTPHKLRHTYACRLAATGADLSVVQDLLGHASPATTRVYMRNDPRRLIEAVSRL
jgi:integrase/recombinase XerD